jgi:hypothetical protein
VVAHRAKIKKRNLEPGIERRALAVDGIKMPVDVFEVIAAAINGEVEIFVAEQTETMGANLIGFAQNFCRFAGQIFLQQVRTLRNFVAGAKKLTRSRRRIAD